MTSLINALIKANVIKYGKVRLASGVIADYYIDLKSAFGNPEILTALANALSVFVPKSATVIASGGYGGIPLATAVSLRTKLPLTLIRSKPKTHGTAQWLDGYIPNSRDKVVLIDDVYTTGGSLKEMEQSIRKAKAKTILRIVVIDRSTKLPHDVKALIPVKNLLK